MSAPMCIAILPADVAYKISVFYNTTHLPDILHFRIEKGLPRAICVNYQAIFFGSCSGCNDGFRLTICDRQRI